MKSSISLCFLSIFAFIFLPASFIREKPKILRRILLCAGCLALASGIGIWAAATWIAPSSAQTAVNFSSLEPKDVVALYWDASLRGDGKVLLNLVSKEVPDSFYRECPTPYNEEAASDKLEILQPSYNMPDEVARKVGGHKMYKKLFGEVEYDSLTYTVYFFSHYLFLNKPSLATFNLSKQNIYDDEALLEIMPLTNPQDYSTQLFFLKKESTGWKIFSVDNRGTLFNVGNKKFGQLRQCK